MIQQLSSQEFEYISGLLKNLSGISLGADKQYLFETRLQNMMAAHDCANLGQLVEYLQLHEQNTVLMQQFIEAMTTNESMFFRDIKPFIALREHLLPELYAQRQHALKIWCAACSSGQEAYSLAMMLDDVAIEATIDASDIDAQMIARAREGIYTQFEVQRGLPTAHLLKYFSKITPHSWQLDASLMQRVQFSCHNLLMTHPIHKQYDMVLCRYVLIYFDEATKLNVLKNIAATMRSGGYLLLGSAETLIGHNDYFIPHPTEAHVYIAV